MVSLLQSKYLVDIFLYQFFCGDLDWTDSCRHFVVDSGICSLSKQYVNDLGAWSNSCPKFTDDSFCYMFNGFISLSKRKKYIQGSLSNNTYKENRLKADI